MALTDKQMAWCELRARGMKATPAAREAGYSQNSVKDLQKHEGCQAMIKRLTHLYEVKGVPKEEENHQVPNYQEPVVVDPNDKKAWIRAELMKAIELAKKDMRPVYSKTGKYLRDGDGEIIYRYHDLGTVLKALDQLAKLEKLYETDKVNINVAFDEVMKLRQQALEADQGEGDKDIELRNGSIPVHH